MYSRGFPRLLIGATLIWLLIIAQTEAQETYKLPPPEVVEILDAPPLPTTRLSPDGEYLLFMYRESMPSIEELAIPYLNLAGFRIDPHRNTRYSPTARMYALRVEHIHTGEGREITVPEGANISDVQWSTDSRSIAFTNTTESGVELWVADVVSGDSRKIPGIVLNGIPSPPIQWIPGQPLILAHVIPDKRGEEPTRSLVPLGPIVQESDGRPAPARTYQNLLTNPDDERKFEYYATSQLVRIDVETNHITKLGAPAIFRDVSPSPDGRMLLVTQITRPYSYLVPAFRFPSEVEVWTTEGEKVAHLASIPLAETIPLLGVVSGPRGHRWFGIEGSRVMYIEALDEGDPRVRAEYRDQVMVLEYPFDGEPITWMKTKYRFRAVQWGDGIALLDEFDRPMSRQRTWLLSSVDLSAEPKLLFDRDPQDRYNDPGSPVLTFDDRGNRKILHSRDGSSIYLSGPGASPQGDMPFLDRLNLETLQSERLWRTDEDVYEYVVDLLDRDARLIITRRESQTEPPNYFLRDLTAGTLKALTHFRDPHPQLTGIERKLLTYEREDGIQLSATLYLPPGFQKGDRPPLVVWVYPFDFVNPDAAGQVRGNPNRFTFFRGASHLFFLTQGYAVLDGPSLPIIGEFGNDTYAEQLVLGLKAAVAKVEQLDLVDTQRMGIGGHSYGAFSTANALIHTDLFKAGIARSGAYNRTLTPFGFQFERRTFWEAPETYMNVSPFTHADKINQPLLILHGMDDSNSGTYPIQSDRLFHAMRGLGGIARYVQYPFEDHGYRARETIMDVLYHMIDWFDTHVKNQRITEK